MSETSEPTHAETLEALRDLVSKIDWWYGDLSRSFRDHPLGASVTRAKEVLGGARKDAADDAQKRTREIDRVICDHGHVSDQVRDLQRAVLRVCDVIDVLMDVAQLDRLSGGAIRHLVAHEVGRHSGDPIEWVPKRESPFRAEDE